MPALDGWGSLPGTWKNLFHDHEIYVRTGGHVRFVRLSAALQRRVATLVLAVLGAWALGTLALLGWQAWTSWQTRDVEQRAAAVAMAEARVTAERQSVEGLAASIDARQDQLEALVEAHFGDDPAVNRALEGAAATAPAPADAALPSGPVPPATGSAPADQLSRIMASGARQERLVLSLADAVERRADRAEAALQTVGIRPRATSAQGGPFVPYPGLSPETAKDPSFGRLVAMLERMERLESLLVAIPSGQPAAQMELSSGFGYRYDPFNGQRAMHAGLDFRGAHGSPILAAAPGRVSFAGVKPGYGYVVEVDHGHGILTRYAHLSGFVAKVGQEVQTGERIGKMGSTGRSTGTHLHFEVRVNGTAVNPRRFLEANAHVLEVKADAGSRVRSLAAAG